MPVTVTAPRGVLTRQGEREILPQLIAALIETSGLTGNSFFTPIVGGTLHLLDPHDIYAGGVNRPVIMIELKLPDIGLPTVEARAAFITAATRIAAALTDAPHDPEDIWVNILNAPRAGGESAVGRGADPISTPPPPPQHRPSPQADTGRGPSTAARRCADGSTVTTSVSGGSVGTWSRVRPLVSDEEPTYGRMSRRRHTRGRQCAQRARVTTPTCVLTRR